MCAGADCQIQHVIHYYTKLLLLAGDSHFFALESKWTFATLVASEVDGHLLRLDDIHFQEALVTPFHKILAAYVYTLLSTGESNTKPITAIKSLFALSI